MIKRTLARIRCRALRTFARPDLDNFDTFADFLREGMPVLGS